MCKLLLDIELLLYRYSFRHKTNNNLCFAINDLSKHVERLYKYTNASCLLMPLSSSNNYRKQILECYKGNASRGHRPEVFDGLRQYVKDSYPTLEVDNLEADDIIGVYATYGEGYLIASLDKDLDQIPGDHYNWTGNVRYYKNELEADIYHMYQTMVGDTADNYFGIPGVGPKKALKILGQVKEYTQYEVQTSGEEFKAKYLSNLWKRIVREFKFHGLTEDQALVQARVARILRASDYDFNLKQPKLWEPCV